MKKNPLLYSFIAAILILTIIDMINSDKSFSELENRNLRGRVKFSIKTFWNGNFQRNYESYINDQFVLRDSWIDLKSRSEYALGKIENNNIIYGKDNYLFDKITYVDEHRINTNINSINDFSKKFDNISMMIIPNSYEIYKNKLPLGAPVINQSELINYIYNNVGEFNKIDLLNIMKENKDKYIYYKTDHHWTTYGAYIAYKEFMKSINNIPINLENLEENKAYDFYGTYFSKAKPFNAIPDILSYYDFENIEMYIDNKKYDGIYDYSKLNIRDKYSLFLRGNNPMTVIKNKNLNNGKRLLIFKDSFGNSLTPFLTQNYEEIHVIDLRSYIGEVSQYIKDNKFDDILILYNLNNFINDANIVKLKY